jgi:hypothetical protein
MLKIYDAKSDIPEGLAEHYERRSDGKYEPKIEGINSLGGLIAKRDELLEKVREIPTLKSKIVDLESLETVPEGKIAVDKAEFDNLKAQTEAYAALGTLDEIKPKVEGYDDLKARDESRSRQEQLRAVAKAAGFNEERFLVLVGDKPFETVQKTVNDNGKAVEQYFVRHTDDKGKTVETAIQDYIQTAPNFAPFADTLTAGSGGQQHHQPLGHKVIKQGTTTPATPNVETEAEAMKASGKYAAL